MSVLMQLGSFQFSVETAAYSRLSRQTEYRWATQERLSRLPARQYVGPGNDNISIEGAVYPHYKGGSQRVEALRTLAARGEPLHMVSMPTLFSGVSHGQWVIESVEEDQEAIGPGGVPRKQSFVLMLSAYGQDS